MSLLTEALNRICNWLEKNRSHEISFLQLGLSEIEIEKYLADFPFKLSTEVRELYEWKNGTIIGDDLWEFCWAFESWGFYPLEVVISRYRERIKSYQAGMSILSSYLNKLDIFFTVEPEDRGYVLIDDKTQNTSLVVFESCKAGTCSPIIKYASLTNMMLTISDCYENAYYRNSDGYLVPDNEIAYQIWRKYNSYRITEVAVEKLKGELSIDLLIEVEADLIKAKHSVAVEPLIKILKKPFFSYEELILKDLAIKVLGEIGDIRAIEPISKIKDTELLKTVTITLQKFRTKNY
ncbi:MULTISPECIES: SMI1/KNR4 family protein [Calothrix]|uniref:SMI1/KNR4 family protein n=2 Tax=Calothrix TaxID=1186 RepID=A0ABR8A5F9_9CYAN|nr:MULTISPECIES: SMI1/KNR4 family protein [Calothrix]MBD2195207.1 SMI1/KNR4 family protein [Calothrix parietina FACHB-288]MBD2223822.1 SMI1/KNR4 family protein [Calothrix anomala FACHB-343]